jgi:hypothetical protein
MAKYESGVKQIPYSQSVVYGKLSDLSNLESLKEKMGTTDIPDNIKDQASEEQINKAKEVFEKMEFTADTISIDVAPIGKLMIEIIERQPEKLIKMTSTQSPVPLTLWIQLVPTGDESCKMRLTLETELNMFLKMMIGSKLKDGIDKFADMLARIPYNS